MAAKSLVVAFAGGYSAGHLTTGFALARELKVRDASVRCIIIGTQDGPESTMVNAEGLRFEAVRSLPYARGSLWSKVRALLMLPRSVWNSHKHLRAHGVTDVVLLGGHTSIGPGFAALLLALPVHLVEPNFAFGRANRLFANRARFIFVGPLFAGTTHRGIARRVRPTGVPIRQNIQSMAGHRRVRTAGVFKILVLGGSLGHGRINQVFPGVCRGLIAGGAVFQLRHQCGLNHDAAALKTEYDSMGVTAEVSRYIEDIHTAYQQADVAVTAAGAITLFELSSVGLPGIVVPLLDSALDHQSENAAKYHELTGALVCDGSNFSLASMTTEILRLMNDPEYWTAQSLGASRACANDSVRAICDLLLSEAGA